MASRFWVGGTGNWDAATTTHWSATTGGGGGASVPTSADTVTFDGNSGVGTVTITATANCSDLTMSAYGGTLAGSAAINIAGSSSWGGTITYTGAITYTATATGKTITNNGKTLASAITFNGVGGGWTLADAANTSAAMTLTAGSFSDGGFSVTCASFTSANSTTRTFTKSGNWTITGSGLGVNISTTTGMTAVIDATKDWSYTFAGATASSINVGTGIGNVGNLKITAGTFGFTIIAGVFTNIDFTGYSGALTVTAGTYTGNYTQSTTMSNVAGGTLTFTGTTAKTLTSNGVAYNHNLTINGTGSVTLADALTTTVAITLTQGGFSDGGFTLTTGAFSSNNANVRSVTKSANWFISGNGNCVNFNTATNLTASFDNTKAWSFTNAGSVLVQPIWPSTTTSVGSLKVTAGTYNFDPLNAGVVSGTGSFADVDFTGFSGSLVGRAITFSGNFTVSATMSFATTSTSLQPMGTGAQTIRSNGVTLNHAIAVNCTGTFKPLDALNVGAQQISVLTGTFDDNGFSATMLSFASSGTGVRTVNKTVDWTITGTGSVTNFSTVTNLTVNFDTTKSWIFSNTTATTLAPSFASSLGNVGHAKVTGSTGIVTLGGANATGTYNDIDFTGSSCALGTSSVTLTGSLTLSATMTCSDLGSSLTFLPAVGVTKNIRSNGVALNHGINVNGPGTVKLLDALNLGAANGVLGLNVTGIFDDGGFSVLCRIFAASGALARTLNQAGPWTVAGTFPGGNIWNVNSSTNLTINSSNSISVTDSSSVDKNWVGDSFFYPSVIYAPGAGTGRFVLSVAPAASTHYFGTLTDTGTAAHTIVFGAGMTYNIGTFAVGGSAGNLVTLQSSVPGTQYNVNKTGGGNVNTDYLSVSDMVGGPGYPWFVGPHSVNGGNNLGVAFCTAANASIMELAA